MPRFYFDMIEGENLTLDRSGIVCDSAAKAKALATQTLVDIAREHCGHAQNVALSIVIRQSMKTIGRTTLTLAVSDFEAAGSAMTAEDWRR